MVAKANRNLSSNAGRHVHIGNDPNNVVDVGTIRGNAGGSVMYYWVGLEVVQKRNIRSKRAAGIGAAELIYSNDPTMWDSPTYLALKKSVTMPDLGGTIYLDDWTATRILEQVPPGCLLTAAEGGEAIASYLLEQIESGVSLPEITKGSFELNKKHGTDGATLTDLLSDADEDQIRDALKKRGLDHLLPVESDLDEVFNEVLQEEAKE